MQEESKTQKAVERRAETLRQRGMSSEGLVQKIIAEEFARPEEYRKEIGKGRLKAQMWDRMQYLFRNFYDRMEHMRLSFEGFFDVAALSDALMYAIERAPVLHSSFHTTPLRPYWRIEDYKIGDFLTVEKAEDPEEAAERFLQTQIPSKSNAQLRLGLFEGAEGTELALVVNHMCFDGGDLKYFVYTLFDNYGKLLAGDLDGVRIKRGDRAYEQVYSKFEGEQLKHARGLYKNTAKCKDKVGLPFAKPKKTDTNRILRKKLSEEGTAALVAKCKREGITVNDAIMACYAHAVARLLELEEGQTATFSCAIDLRRHIKNGGLDGGLTNHTAWLACRVPASDLFCTLDEIRKSMNAYKLDPYIGLYSLPLLKLGFTIFPQPLAEFAIKLGYDNPRLAISNMGRLDDARLTPRGMALKGGSITGTTKYKPYFLMSVTTLKNAVTISTAYRGSDADAEMMDRLFELIAASISVFTEAEKARA